MLHCFPVLPYLIFHHKQNRDVFYQTKVVPEYTMQNYGETLWGTERCVDDKRGKRKCLERLLYHPII